MSDTAVNKVLQYGTNAARLAFTPNPATGSKILYFWYTTDTTTLYLWNGSSWVSVSAGSATTFPARCQGRLTVATGVPVPTTDQTGKSTLYWTPCIDLLSVTHGVISLWNGTGIVDVSITEISLALSALTSAKNYDVFVDYNSGTPQIVLSAAWTNDTTRADALSSQYDSARLETIIVKSGTPAYRWVGTIRTTGTTTTEDSLAKRFVWNACNKALRRCYRGDATSHTYNSNTIRQWNNDTANQIDFIDGQGVMGYPVVFNAGEVAPSGGGGSITSFQLDATNSEMTGSQIYFEQSGSRLIAGTGQVVYPGLGRHFIAAVERATANTGTFANFDLSMQILN